MDQELRPADVRRAAMDLLARREHSQQELTKKLASRFRRFKPPANLIETEVERLIEEGLLSDDRYAVSMFRQLLYRGLGPRRVQQELRLKGIRQTLDTLFDESGEHVDWFGLAEQTYRKKFSAPIEGDDRNERLKERAKRIRFMQYRGFESDHYEWLLEERSSD